MIPRNIKHIVRYQVQTAAVANPRNGRDPWKGAISYHTFETTPFAMAALDEVKTRFPKKRHRLVRVTEEVVIP